VAYAPFIDEETRIRAGAKKVPCQIVATWPSFTGIRAFNARWGRFFTMEEERELERVVVLGVKVAERLFQTPERALGRMVFLQRAAFRVIGVMEPKGRDLSGTDQDEQVFMPLTTYMRRAANVDHIGGVYLRAAKGADLTRIKDAAASLLRRRHQIGPGETDDFTVLTARESIQLQRQALDLVFTLGVISSSVSFAVGGLGILSIMILLVRARRLEIGIRRAVGARRRDIVRQFLLESAIMSTTGGLLGVGAAAGLSLGLSLAGVFPLVVDQTVVSLSLAGSAILGVAAGAYPAWTASRLEILGVLRDQ
jgi:putative ABC transport system permease protein